MKKLLTTALAATLLVGCSDNEVGNVDLGIFSLKDVVNNTRQFFFN